MNIALASRAFIFALLLWFPLLESASQRDNPLFWVVPEGELVKRGGRELYGTVVDANGAALPGVLVTLQHMRTRASRVDHTDTKGRFLFRKLASGRYQVTVSAEGFSTFETEINIATGAGPTLAQTLKMKDRSGGVLVAVPEGEKRRSVPGTRHSPETVPPSRGRKPPGAAELHSSVSARAGALANRPILAAGVEVIEMSFDSETKLQEWLNRQAGDRKQLLGIVPLRDATSLFLFTRVEAGLQTILVMPFIGSLTSAELSSRIKLHPDDTFVGVHQLSDKSCLIVFRSNPAIRSR